MPPGLTLAFSSPQALCPLPELDALQEAVVVEGKDMSGQLTMTSLCQAAGCPGPRPLLQVRGVSEK